MKEVTFTAVELINMKKDCRAETVEKYTEGELYLEDKIIAKGKSISTFYVKILSHFVSKGVDVEGEFGKKCNRTGEPINKSANMTKIPDTDLYVNTRNGNDYKFSNIQNFFTKLKESDELIENYKFKLYKTDSNMNEAAQEVNRNNQNMSEKIEEIVVENILKNKQVIFTGAPGTGKTWLVKSYVEGQKKEQIDMYKFVQFHSSYDYTDFVEGLRPVPDKNGGNMFVRMDGVFKSFCRNIVEKNLKRINEQLSESMTIEDYFKYMKDQNNRKRVYEILNGMPYYFIIDEINRADLSRVFGELMYGLEESYREIHNRFDTQYKNLPTYEMNDYKVDIIADDCFKDGFFVPYNLHIIGTMNDIDRSVESFDFALRRRFIWIDIKANDIMYESLKSMIAVEGSEKLADTTLKTISDKICGMNNKITEVGYGLSEAYHIGPAYFKDLVNASDGNVKAVLEAIFENRIKPILREYMRGRKAEVQDKLIENCRDELLGEKDEKN